MRKELFFLMLLAGVSPAAAVEPAGHFYVLSKNHPSISIVDTTTWRATDRINIDPQPSGAYLGATDKFLYILHDQLDLDRLELAKAAKKAAT